MLVISAIVIGAAFMCLEMRMADKYLCSRLFLWCLPCVNRWRKPKALWKSGTWWRIILTLLFPGGQRSRAGPAVLTTLRSEVHNGGPVPDWWVFPDPSVPWKQYSGTLSEHIFLQHHDTLEFWHFCRSFEQQLYVKAFFSPPNLSNLSLALKL